VRGFTDTPDVCKVVVMYLQEEYAHRDAALKPNDGTGQAKADELRIPRPPRVLCCRQSGEVLNATGCATAAIRSALRMPSQSKQYDLPTSSAVSGLFHTPPLKTHCGETALKGEST
jgi:hypothetical protein